MSTPRARGAARIPWALPVFAIAMGWLEGVVVVYIRGLVGLAHSAATPPPAEVMARLTALPWLVRTEQTREVATIVMLLAAAWLATRSAPGRAGAFLIAFGIWDIAYYAALYVLLGWPSSLTARDVLFLIPPHPWWYQPVWVPLAISCGMVGAGAWLMRTTRIEVAAEIVRR